MNKVILMGRLTRDPEVRYSGDTAIARFSIAVDRKYKKDGGQEADFPSIVTFGKTAEFCEKYLKQGVKIAIEGRLQTGSYTNKDGVKVYTTDVIAEAVEFAESKKQESPQPKTDNNGFMEIPKDVADELPFM
jgi:single-strand DNA-binding protein